MKTIHTHTAVLSNSGGFLDAGEHPVGDEDNQISNARAAALIEAGLASEGEAEATTKAASRK